MGDVREELASTLKAHGVFLHCVKLGDGETAEYVRASDFVRAVGALSARAAVPEALKYPDRATGAGQNYDYIKGWNACRDAMLAAAPQPAGEVVQTQAEQPRPMGTAPRDGTMVRLLVDFDEHDVEDSPEPSWTVGVLASDEPDAEWQFAGWCWTHDHFTEGKGKPIGWLPMLSEPAPSVPDHSAEFEAWSGVVNAASELETNAPGDRFRRRANSVRKWVESKKPIAPSAPADVVELALACGAKATGKIGGEAREFTLTTVGLREFARRLSTAATGKELLQVADVEALVADISRIIVKHTGYPQHHFNDAAQEIARRLSAQKAAKDFEITLPIGCRCQQDVEIGNHANQVELETPAFMRALGRVGCLTFRETTSVDRCVASLVQALWERGVVTTGSCCGHNQRNGYVGIYAFDHTAKDGAE